MSEFVCVVFKYAKHVSLLSSMPSNNNKHLSVCMIRPKLNNTDSPNCTYHDGMGILTMNHRCISHRKWSIEVDLNKQDNSQESHNERVIYIR